MNDRQNLISLPGRTERPSAGSVVYAKPLRCKTFESISRPLQKKCTFAPGSSSTIRSATAMAG
jgi:hypothetical protein